MRSTKIVCTLGPSSDSAERIRDLIVAGMNVARLNFSHGDHLVHERTFSLVRSVAAELDQNVAILVDLQGPKIRTGTLRDGQPVLLSEGASFCITTREHIGTVDCVSTTYANLPLDVQPGNRILIADGAIELCVENVSPPEVHCRVVHGGMLGERKGINLPGVAVSAPSLTDKDLEDLRFALELGADYVALSFVRRPEDVASIKEHIRAAGHKTRVVAKIERPEALDYLDEIIGLSDAVMVARGDLGVEMPLDDVPQVQKSIIRKCNLCGVPVITATQMLESMVSSPRPTRAEVTDVANAIYDGTDAIMLSAETSTGQYPVEAVRVMAQIAEKADNAVAKSDRDATAPPSSNHTIASRAAYRPCAHPDGPRSYGDAIGHAVRHISETLPVKSIVCFTMSGYTALTIARFRPLTPIVVLTLTEEARRRCALVWGVDALRSVEISSVDEMLREADLILMTHGLAQPGDTLVLVAGTPLAIGGRTNLIKLHTVGEEV